MGMTIETAVRNLSMYDVNECGNAELHTWYKGIEEDMEESFKVAIETMRKYQLFQVEYTKRLRADTVAMLEDLKEQLREMHEDFFETEHFDEAYGVSDSMDLIEEKISNLKED